MTAEILLTRPLKEIPWGFRLIGGSDSHLPIIISKVVEGSIAEKAELTEDVLLEEINNVPTSGLTHAEVHRIILAAEDRLLLTIRRVNLENLILASLNEEENNSEISNILRQAAKNETGIGKKDEFEGPNLQREYGLIISENNDKIGSIDQRKKYNMTENKIPPKKWTTFLQKPNHPRPIPNSKSPSIAEEDRYRVIITKQPKPTFKPKEIPQTQTELEKEEETLDNNIKSPLELEMNFESHESEKTEITVEEMKEVHVESHESEKTELTVEEMKEIHVESHESEKTEVTLEEMKEVQVDEAHIDENIQESLDKSMSIEEQLAAIQKKLQELAQLPTSIQETLVSVSEQLDHIVGEKTSTASVCIEEHETNEEETNETSDEGASSGVTEEENGSEGEILEDQGENVWDKADMDDVQSATLFDISEEQDVVEIMDEVEQEGSTDTELQQKCCEISEHEKRQMEIEEQSSTKTNITRPIILPGGRKWANPDNVEVKVTNSKMTDERICETLQSFSEIIVGKTKGINFLKYTPPPKNLGYLQQSEVYRLVHGMEPPVKGISLRSERILAAQDYCSAGDSS